MKRKAKIEIDFIQYFKIYIKDSLSGKRLQKNGKKIKKSTIEGYKALQKLLQNYCTNFNQQLRIISLDKLNRRQLKSEDKYWKIFYKKFTDYLFKQCNYYDNYVGVQIKRLRAFFNYLNKEKLLNIGQFHKSFYCYNEEIEVITLLPEQLNFLIYDKAFENSLENKLIKTKNFFVFGCTVALRVSDLLNLTHNNIENVNNRYYLRVVSKKTNKLSRILLPDYAINIIKQTKNKTNLLPKFSIAKLNLNIKLLIEKAGWTNTLVKTRQKRGINQIIYRKIAPKSHFRFCDLVCCHTMRRTAITTMLCLDMPENLVRQISGHSPNSKEFYKYVQLSQSYKDMETIKVFEKLKEKEYFARNNIQ